VLWLIWCLALALASGFGTSLPLWSRVPLLVGLIWLARLGVAALRGPGKGLQRLSWGSDGRWQLQNRLGELAYVELAAAPQHFGPLVWLRLRGENQRETVLIDTRTVEPVVLAALKARLRLDRPGQGS
jgi:hypothetical protein